MNTIDVHIVKILFNETAQWSQSGVPYVIAKAYHDGSYITIKGEMAEAVESQKYRLHGEIKTDQNPKYGDYFAFHAFEILSNRSESGIIEYLDRFVPGFGPVRARKLITLYGLDAIDVLKHDPDKVLAVPGITPAIVDRIREHFSNIAGGIDPHDYAALHSFIGDQVYQSVLKKLLVDFKSSACNVIRKNPYILQDYHGVGWPTADSVAIDKCKFKKDDIRRFKAGVLECLRRAENEGHTYLTRAGLKGAMQRVVGLGGPVDEAVAAAAAEEKIAVDSDCIALRATYEAEKGIAREIRRIMDTWNKSREIPFATEGLDGEQIDAVKYLESQPFALLIGGAGVGKTTTVTNIFKSLHKAGRVIGLNTPTGKAAKRASEALEKWLPGSGIAISTMHSALGAIGSGEGVGVPDRHAKFGHERKSMTFAPGCLPYTDANADEGSMVPNGLMYEWLRRVPDGSRVLIVGDENQLPSVECGSVLRDMIAAGVPCARLTKPRRNSGAIVRACHAIKDGIVPTPPAAFDPANGDNWFHIETSDPVDIAETMAGVHAWPRPESGPPWDSFDPLWDLQALSVENEKKPIACDNLNRLLSLHFNAANHADDDPSKKDAPKYAKLDKVVRTDNGTVAFMHDPETPLPSWAIRKEKTKSIDFNDKEYELHSVKVVNGDIGQVVDFHRGHVVVLFKNPDRLCWLPRADACIRLAYAITTHKAQGSGWPVVILPLHDSFYPGLWNREMLYTMFSRAEQILITVGKISALRLAVSRKTIDRRQTRLAEFIRKELAS